MVGVGGGIANFSKGIDIHLEDIVVSKPEKIWGGVKLELDRVAREMEYHLRAEAPYEICPQKR